MTGLAVAVADDVSIELVLVVNDTKSEAMEIGTVSGGNVGITGVVCPPMTSSHAAASPALSTHPSMVSAEAVGSERVSAIFETPSTSVTD